MRGYWLSYIIEFLTFKEIWALELLTSHRFTLPEITDFRDIFFFWGNHIWTLDTFPVWWFHYIFISFFFCSLCWKVIFEWFGVSLKKKKCLYLIHQSKEFFFFYGWIILLFYLLICYVCAIFSCIVQTNCLALLDFLIGYYIIGFLSALFWLIHFTFLKYKNMCVRVCCLFNVVGILKW